MFKNRALALALLLLIGMGSSVKAQQRITAIHIEGNAKTKEYIISRELPYKVGDTFSKDSLQKLNIVSEHQLINTSLFLSASVITKEIDSINVEIAITVKERWYLFPLPYFRWVDRNFSEWWNVQHRSLDRVNYGLNFKQSNATGNNDKLTIGIISGYTQQTILRYQFPYLDKQLKFGAALGWQYFTQKEINTSTVADKQVFTKTIDINQKGYRANINLLYRPNLFNRHSLQIGYGNSEISDSIFLRQANYMPNYKKSFSYVDFNLAFTHVKFNYNAYPSQGSSTEFALYQRLSNSSNLSSFQFRKIWAHEFSKKTFYYIESNSIGKIIPNRNYLDSRLMGYGNMQMNGLEYYVVDGNAGTILKTELHFLLGSYTVPKTSGIKIIDIFSNKLPDIHYNFWLKAFTNVGYVYSERPANASKLSNTLLRTAGIGLDIISIYDFVLKIDYSVNQLGDKGVYLHGGINF
jgi:outer membrane protein assembly factor BamA